MLSHITESAVAAFVNRAARLKHFLPGGLAIYENPTEEILHGVLEKRPVKLFAKGSAMAARKAGGLARLEEQYLYSTRRFPTASNNTIGSGALTAGTYPFFGKAIGDDAVGIGFPTGSTVTLQETNMEQAGQIPQGASFVLNQLGVSFNADAVIADVNQFLEAGTLQFAKTGGTFTLNLGPLKLWPGGTGNGGSAAAATTVAATTLNIQAASNGAIDIRAVRNLRIARTLREKETFAFNILINRSTKAKDGAAFALSDFLVCTIWGWGGGKTAIVG